MSYNILSKFIKDISFEIPNAETFVMLEKEIQKYNLIFDIKSKPYKNNIIEVNTVLRLTPSKEIKHKIGEKLNVRDHNKFHSYYENQETLDKVNILMKEDFDNLNFDKISNLDEFRKKYNY